jgi:hypothetical protein
VTGRWWVWKDGEWMPLSVREGGPWAKLEWRLKLLREAVALAIAPWLRRTP